MGGFYHCKFIYIYFIGLALCCRLIYINIIINSIVEMLRSLQAANNLQTQQQDILLKQLPIFLKKYKYEQQPSKQDQELCLSLMKTIQTNQNQIKKKLQSTLQSISQRQYTKGIGYYNAKNIIFMEYLIQLQFYQLFKINGISFAQGQGLNLYKRLAYLKILLTKLGPIEKKLEYQKNKMLKQSDLVPIEPQHHKEQSHEDSLQEQQELVQHGSHGEQLGNKEVQQESDSDDLAYRPRPQALLKVKKNKQINKPDKYIAPKTSAVLSKQDKIKRRQQIQEERRKVALIKKYRDDIIQDDDARQIGAENEVQQRIKQRFNQKRLIEEEHFMRFPETKKEKFLKKQIIRNFNKSDDLRDTLKQVEMVGKIYKEQRKAQENVPILQKKEKKQHTLQKKQGRKRTKMQ